MTLSIGVVSSRYHSMSSPTSPRITSLMPCPANHRLTSAPSSLERIITPRPQTPSPLVSSHSDHTFGPSIGWINSMLIPGDTMHSDHLMRYLTCSPRSRLFAPSHHMSNTLNGPHPKAERYASMVESRSLTTNETCVTEKSKGWGVLTP